MTSPAYKDTPAQLVDATLAVLAALLVAFVMAAIWQMSAGAHAVERDATVVTWFSGDGDLVEVRP